MRPYDGYSDEAMADPTADCREIINNSDFDIEGGSFWLRYIIVRNSDVANDAVLELYDQDEGVAVGANKRGEFDVPAEATTVLDIPAPGIKFDKNCTAGITGATGTIAAYAIHAGGYIVGGM